MNNDAFRKLVSSTPARQDDATKPSKPAALGAKRNAFVPMTPSPGKAASNDDFARQVREQHAQMRPPKKYKSSAPKGSKFGAGYVDRAKARQEASDDQDDKAERIKALEEQAKLGTISWGTFEALRDQITGGDVSSTHLVKGLDRQLLERVRRGEDVLGLGKKSGADDAPVDVDDELEKLGEKEIALVKKEQAEKKGVKAVEPIAGKKRTRDELLAELKAQRKAAAEAKAASAPKLDGRWKKIGEQSKPKVEIDHKGREVVTVVQEDGTVKKMVKKVASNGTTADMPDISKHVLGADVAVPVQKPADADEESDEDIFAGAGTEYDPLGQEDEDEDEDSDDEGDSEGVAEPARKNDAPKESDDEGEVSEEPVDEQQPKTQSVVSTTAKATRNYFGDSSKQTEEEAAKDRFKGIENVLKKAANLAADKTGSDDEDDDPATREEREARKAKRARMLAQQDRDLEDMDLGFGGSRGEDEEDALDAKVKLAEWKGGKAAGDDGWEEDDGKRGDKKKRKPKKRKGDVNNAADIFRVIEGRKAKENK